MERLKDFTTPTKKIQSKVSSLAKILISRSSVLKKSAATRKFKFIKEDNSNNIYDLELELELSPTPKELTEVTKKVKKIVRKAKKSPIFKESEEEDDE